MSLRNLRHAWRLHWHRRRHGDRFTIHGVEVRVPETVELGVRNALLRGRYETGEANAIRRHLRSGDTVIELGGSLGVISRVIRDMIGPEGWHVVVEANPRLIPVCTTNAQAGARPERTRVLHAALAYDCDRAHFQFGANAHIGRVHAAAAPGLVEVPAVTLSTLASWLPAQTPFALVCDIEGAELDLFQQEVEVFHRVSIAIIEIHPEHFERRGCSEADFLALATARGLNCIWRSVNILAFAGTRCS